MRNTICQNSNIGHAFIDNKKIYTANQKIKFDDEIWRKSLKAANLWESYERIILVFFMTHSVYGRSFYPSCQH